MTISPEGPGLPPALGADEAAVLAARHGLPELGGRPPFGAYLRSLWQRRAFIWTLSTSQTIDRNAGDRLGVLWTVLNPLMLIFSYFLIFGLLVPTRKGVENFIAFLAIGVVIFGYTSSAITKGAKAITGNIGLVRALRFPRAVLPISETLTEFVTALPAIGVLLVVMLLSGEPIRWHWLLLPVALVIQTGILGGLIFMSARLLNVSRDLGNLIPVGIRLMRYVSGVFFSIASYGKGHAAWVTDALTLQPFALPISLARQCLLTEVAFAPREWVFGLIWATILPIIGLWLFWWDEARYGRS